MQRSAILLPLPLPLLLLLTFLAPFSLAQCPVIIDPQDPDKVYDLSPLASTTDYECMNIRYPTYTFKINVCRPLVYNDTTCIAGTGICERSSFSSSRIAMASNSFTLTSPGKLQMNFPSGSGCFSGIINFICKEGGGIGSPVYVSENCIYSFNWETEYACSRTSSGGGGDVFKFTRYFGGGLPFCSQCGTTSQYACSPDSSGRTIGEWNDGLITFDDQIPTGYYATNLNVAIYGAFSCNLVGQRAVMAVTLNGFTHGVRDTTKGVNQCKCDTCDGSEIFDLSFRNGVPKYKYGGVNNLQIDLYRDSICINRVEISVRYERLVVSPPTPLPEEFFNLVIPTGYDRVGCNVCNEGLNQWCSASNNNSLRLSFMDPLPANAILLSVDFSISLGMVEKSYSFQYSSISGSLQNFSVGNSVRIDDTRFIDKCQCLGDFSMSSDTFQRGWPGYIYGGANSVSLLVTKPSQSYGNVCVGRFNVNLIYYILADGEKFPPKELLISI